MKRDVLHSPRLSELKKRRRRAIFNKFFIILFGLAILFAFSAYFSKLEGLNINQIEILGNKVVETSQIQSEINELIAGKYLWIFPKANVLYYPKNKIENALQNKFHRLNKINLSIENQKTLTISVTEREAKYTWCGILPKEITLINSNEEKCYFLDEKGYVFDIAPYFSGEVYFKFYGRGELDINNPTGTYFSSQNFEQLILFKNILVSMGIKPTIINILENGDIEIFLAKGEKNLFGPKIIFESDADFKNVAENLQAALGTEPLLSGFKKKYSSLLYIDLRFGNKVYFKFNE